MKRLLRSLPWLVVAVGCGVEDYGKDLPVTQVPVDPPPPPPTPGALSLVVEGSRIQAVVGRPTVVRVRVPERDQLASVLSVTLESPPPGFFMTPANLGLGKDTTELSLITSLVTSDLPEVITLALTSIRGEEARVSVPVEVAGRPGTQDTSFGTSPQVKLGGSAALSSIVLDRSGRAIVSGAEGARAGVARFATSGGVDFAFGNEAGSLGVVHFTPNPPIRTETVQAIAVDDDSRVYGAISVSGGVGSYVQRLQSNGLVDNTFGGGRVTFSDPSLPFGVVVDRDGVVVSGQEFAETRTVAFLRRFLLDGKKDPAFASEWLALDTTRARNAQSLVRSKSGRFAFFSQGNDGIYVFLVEVDGVPVPSFGDRGAVLFPYSEGVMGGVAFADDGLFVFGTRSDPSGTRGRIVKLGFSGARDLAFGTNGEMVATSTTSFTRVVVDGQGRLLTIGRPVSGGSQGVIERWSPKGVLDAQFGLGGRVQPTSIDSWQAIAVRPNGRILAVNRMTTVSPPTLQVTQFWD